MKIAKFPIRLILILLLFLFLLLVSTSAYAFLHHLTLDLKPSKGLLKLTDQFPKGLKPPKIYIPQDIKNLDLNIEDSEIPFTTTPMEENQTKWIELKPIYPSNTGNDSALKISYDFYPPKVDYSDGGMGHINISNQVNAVIEKIGVYLSPASFWYPYVKGTQLETFNIKLTLPQNWSGMTSGNLVSSKIVEGLKIERWINNNQSQRIHLIANQFHVEEESYQGIKLQTYFHPELGAHSRVYINKLKEYLDIYLDYFGFYPFDKFAVVSNFFSTGYGMASYTLLDKNIIPFPFIVNISLGHELLHNWWGNSVYYNSELGNWCEGLTVYQADYLFEKLKGEKQAINYRLNTLRDNQNFVDEENAFPVRKFISRFDPVSRAIGYGKAMMIFHMLKNRIGTNVFNQSLKEIAHTGLFKYINWKDFKNVFEKNSGTDLDRFFKQWLDRKDNPKLILESVSHNKNENELKLRISQVGSHPVPFDIYVPVRIKFEDLEDLWFSLHLTQKRQNFSLDVDGIILAIDLDPNFDLMRELKPKENPPSLNHFWGERNIHYYTTFSNTPPNREVLKNVVGSYPHIHRSSTPNTNTITFLREDDIDNFSLVAPSFFITTANFLSNDKFKKMLDKSENFDLIDTALYIKKDAKEYDLAKTTALITLESKNKQLVVLIAPNEDLGLKMAKKLSHYGKYSFLLFNEVGRKIGSGIW